MANAGACLGIYVARRRDTHLVLALDSENVPSVLAPTPLLVRAEYVLEEDATDERLFQSAQRLEQKGLLLLLGTGVDGSESRVAWIYPRPEDCQIDIWKDAEGHTRVERLHGEHYRASTVNGYDVWQSGS